MATFSGRMTLNTLPMQNCCVKVVNAYHPGWNGSTITTVLDTLGGGDNQNVFVTFTDASGNWSVSGIPPGSYMLKIFPTAADPTCVGYGEIPNPAYITGESGYIESSYDAANFMSTRDAPSNKTYHVYSHGRFLFDMPCHVFPGVPGALSGSQNYNDLNVNFYTRNNFQTSAGYKTTCTSAPPPTVGYVGPTSGAGSLVSQSANGTAGGGNVVSFNYRMVGIDGNVCVARAHAVIPTGTMPAGGRNVIAVCHDAAGLEYGGGLDQDSINGQLAQLISANYVVVFVDNEGLNDAQTGNVRPNPYINRRSAGRGVIDACRAVASITTITGKCAAWGWSQGGATALAAGEMHKNGYGNLNNMLVVAIDAVHPELFVQNNYSGWAKSYCTAICMGAWYENKSLALTSIFDSTSAASISNGSWDNTDVASIPSTFIANPTSVTSWQTALRNNSFGYIRSSRVLLLPASSGIHSGDNANGLYATRAQGQGTTVTTTTLNTDHSGAPAAAFSTALTFVNNNINTTDTGSGDGTGGGNGGGGGEPPVTNPNLAANFTWSPSSPGVGQTVQFTNTSTGSPTEWAWYVSKT